MILKSYVFKKSLLAIVLEIGVVSYLEKDTKRISFKLSSKELKSHYDLIKFKEPNQWLLSKNY